MAVGSYRLLRQTIALTWAGNGAGTIPANAVASGQVSVGGALKLAYFCRTLTVRAESRVGWTVDGKLCSYPELGPRFRGQGRAVATNKMDILVRAAANVRAFNLAN